MSIAGGFHASPCIFTSKFKFSNSALGSLESREPGKNSSEQTYISVLISR